MRFMLFNLLIAVSASLVLVVLFELANRVARTRLEARVLARGVEPGVAARRAYEEAATIF